MAENYDLSDALTALAGLITGILGSLVALKGTKASAEKDFRSDLLQLIAHHTSRIDALEEENHVLVDKNRELAEINLSKQKELHNLETQVSTLQKEREALQKRVEYLESRVLELTERMEKILYERGT
jgi:chromosome segregation ATPase